MLRQGYMAPSYSIARAVECLYLVPMRGLGVQFIQAP